MNWGADEQRLDLSAVDYAEHFKPQSAVELSRIVGGPNSAGYSNAYDFNQVGADDGVPF